MVSNGQVFVEISLWPTIIKNKQQREIMKEGVVQQPRPNCATMTPNNASIIEYL
jgi:hypothetical protein